jgi:hypothetical protein
MFNLASRRSWCAAVRRTHPLRGTRHLIRFAAALSLAALTACTGRWQPVAVTDPRLQRPGATIGVALNGRHERLRVLGVSAEGVRVRRSEPCDSCEVLLPATPADSVQLQCGMGAGLLALTGSAAAIALVLAVVGTSLER